jgi:hypothetical protein
MLGSTDTVNDELDLIHEAKIQLADNIRKRIMLDVDSARFSQFELQGRLGKNAVGITAFKSRKVWTLDYAIIIAAKLGYSLGALSIAHESGLPEINSKDKTWINVLNARNNMVREGKSEEEINQI